VQNELRTLSFGALAEAQESYDTAHSFETRRQHVSSVTDSDKLRILRKSLAELKELKERKYGLSIAAIYAGSR